METWPGVMGADLFISGAQGTYPTRHFVVYIVILAGVHIDLLR